MDHQSELSNHELKAEIIRLLAEKERRRKTRLIDSLYPAVGRLCRDLYPKHMEYFKAGAIYRERCMMAANRIGKSFGAGGYETYLHLSGDYPDWWEGRHFNHPINAWAAGIDSKSTRDIIQFILLGNFRELGTGLIPADRIVDVTTKMGVSNAVEDIYVKHVSGGVSRITLKSYEQGAGSFMGTARHWIWLDEEPPLDIYTECLTRTMTVSGASPDEMISGAISLTFTPLYGLSEVVMMFMPEGRIPDQCENGKFIVNATWDDVPHLTEAMKEEMLKALPPHERNARSKGIPQLGSGRIYPVDEADIAIDPLPIPVYWPRFFGMDVGVKTPTAVVWFAWDRDTDMLYIYREYYRKELLPWEHAHTILHPDPWIPGIIDTAAKISYQGGNQDAGNLFDEYIQLGLKIYPADKSVEAGIYRVHERLQSGRLKVFKTCTNWFAEYRVYRRDKNGVVAAKQADHLLDATRYGVMSGLAIATTRPLDEEDEPRYMPIETGKSKVCGY